MKGHGYLSVVSAWLVLLCTAQADEIQKRHEQMLYPVVRVTTGSTGGSGTVLYSEDRGDGCQTYILTNHHVIDAAVHVKEVWSSLLQADKKREVNDPVTVEVFCYSEGSTQDKADSYRADIVAHDKAHDLALLKLRSARKIPHAVVLLRSEAKIRIFQPIWAVGCSLLHPPVVTEGIIDYLDDVIDRKTYWMGSANIIYGNSGGAVFVKHGDGYAFIGVPSRVSVTGFQAVTHMGYFVPVTRIREWLAAEQLHFLLEKKQTPSECFDRREKLRKHMELKMLREGIGETPVPTPAK